MARIDVDHRETSPQATAQLAAGQRDTYALITLMSLLAPWTPSLVRGCLPGDLQWAPFWQEHCIRPVIPWIGKTFQPNVWAM
jgi:hypothetical protein